MNLNRTGGRYIRDPDTKELVKDIEQPIVSAPPVEQPAPQPAEPASLPADPAGETEVAPAPSAGQKKGR